MPPEPPTPEEVGDALAVIALGGDAGDLLHALATTAAHTSDRQARERLQRAAAALEFASRAHAVMRAELARSPER